MKQQHLPESLFSKDEHMTLEKLRVFYENGSTITGKVIRLNSSDEILEVDLGGRLIGFMPFDESTIYDIYRQDGTTSPNVYTLVGKNINVKIKKISQHIILSRKENMLEALETFKNESFVNFASITNFSKLSAFVDIGAGIIGRSYGKDFSNIFLRKIADSSFKKGDILSFNIDKYDEETNFFYLSRTSTLSDTYNNLNQGDTVFCKVFDKVNSYENGLGYYVLIGDIKGILDSPIPLNYGDTVSGYIKRFGEKGPHLNLVL